MGAIGKMRKMHSKSVSFQNNRVFITLFLHVVIGLLCSFAPEENVGMWIGINLAFAIIFALIN